MSVTMSFILALSLGAPSPEHSAWRFASPREEIAPRAWKDETILFAGKPTLALAGRGLAAANGHWSKRFAVEPGTHYRFETHYFAKNVDEPLRSVLARIIWRDEMEKRVRRTEYPATLARTSGTSETDWSVLRQTYEVPPGAARADVELVFRWDANGSVHFGGTTMAKVEKPAARRVRLASIHRHPKGTGPEENVEEFCELIAQAAAKRADIVCLPEGITLAGTKKTYVDVAESIPGPTTRRLGEKAKEHALYIVAGLFERVGPTVYNTAVLIDRRGELIGRYRKVCLPREEIEGGITPGEVFPVFDVDFGRIGLMICWDVHFAEPAQVLARKGAEVILIPIWGGNLTLTKARAIENQVHLVTSSYHMKTAVFDKEGTLVKEGSNAEPVVVVEVDLNERTLWPWLGDLKNRIPRERPPANSLRE